MKIFTKLLLTGLMFLFVWMGGAQAQVAGYSFSSSAGTYNAISGGTAIPSTSSATLDNNVQGSIGIGFTFNYNGTNYTEVGYNANGWISLGSATPTSSLTPISGGSTNNVISAFGVDLIGRLHFVVSMTSGSNVLTVTSGNTSTITIGSPITGTGIAANTTVTAVSPTTITMSNNASSTGTGRHGRVWQSEVRYETLGSAPNRKFVFQFKDFSRYSTTASNGDALNFQIVLNETTNKVDIIYNCTPPSAAGTITPQVGLRGSANTDYNNRTTTTDWSSTTAGSINSATCSYSNTVYPASGQTFTWTPPLPCTGTPSAGSISGLNPRPTCGGSAPSPTTVTVTGQTTGVTGISFQWETSTDNVNWTDATGTGNATITYTLPSHTAGQTEYYRLKATCANSGLSGYSDVLQVTDPAAPGTQASNISTSALGNTTATITWTNGSGTRRYVVLNTTNSFTDPVDGSGPALTANAAYAGSGQQIVFDGTGTSVSVTGLSPNTTYYARVYEYIRCGSSAPFSYYYQTSTGTNNPGSFTTTLYCTPSTSGGNTYYINNFTTTAGATNINNNSGGSSSGYEDFSGSVSMSAYKGDVINYSMTVAGGGTYGKAIWIDFNQNGIFEAGEQVVTSSAYASSPLTGNFTIDPAAATGMTRMRILATFTPNNPSNSCVNSGSGEYEDYSINILAPSCAKPTALSGTPTSPTSADLSWTAPVNPPSNGYEWVVDQSASDPAGSGTPENGTSASVGSLMANTTYYLHVRSNCGGNGYSAWATSATFKTPCNPASIPFFEGFESGYSDQTEVAGCWSQESVSGTEVWTANSTLTDYNRTPRSGSFNAYLKYSNNQWLFYPVTLTGGTSYTFSVYARQDGATSTNAKISLAYGATATAAGMTNVVVNEQGIINGNYQEVTGSFTPASSGTYYIGIKGNINFTPWYISLDDISLVPTPTSAVDWCNLQFPSSGSIQTGQSLTVYTQGYEPGVTDGTGQGAGINVWVGTSTTNSDPSGGGWTWTAATFNVDAGNNDEYSAAIGSGLTPGTYYYASRWQLNGGPYKYGGYSAGGGGFWDGTTYVNGELTVTVGPCLSAPNGQFPSTTFTPSCIGTPEDITNGWAGEYSKVNLTNGEEYVFTSSKSTDWITISDENGTVAYAYGLTPLTWTATGTATYRFYTHKNSNCDPESSSRTRAIQCGTIPTPPANDDCSGAIALTVTPELATQPVLGTMAGATPSSENFNGSSCNTYSTSDDVWYSVTIPASGKVNVYTFVTGGTSSSDNDYSMQAYQGTCGNLTYIGCSEDVNLYGTPTAYMPALQITGTANTVIYLRVRKTASSRNDFAIAAFDPDAEIPLSTSDCVSGSVNITKASGNGYRFVPLLDNAGNLIGQLFPYGEEMGIVNASVHRNTTGTVRQDGDGVYYLDRDFTIEVQNLPSDEVDFYVYFTVAELQALMAVDPGVTAPGDLNATKNPSRCGKVVEKGGTFLENYNNLTRTGGDHAVAFSTGSFSTFYLHGGSTPLPVQVVTFTARAINGKQVGLNWNVAAESLLDGYVVEHSTDGRSFEAIGKVKAAQKSAYAFVHDNPAQGINYYRLRMLDDNGAFKLSEVRQVVFTNGRALSLYPNPTSGLVYVSGLEGVKEGAYVNIYNEMGMSVFSGKIGGDELASKGIDMSMYATGAYVIRVISDEVNTTMRFVKE